MFSMDKLVSIVRSGAVAYCSQGQAEVLAASQFPVFLQTEMRC